MSAVDQAVRLSAISCPGYQACHSTDLVVKRLANSIALVQESRKPPYKKHHKCSQHRVISGHDEHLVYNISIC